MQVTVKYYEVEIDVEFTVEGRYYPATQEEPEEYPELCITNWSYLLTQQEDQSEEDLSEFKQELEQWLESYKLHDAVWEAYEQQCIDDDSSWYDDKYDF